MSADIEPNRAVGAELTREPGVVAGPSGFSLPWLDLEAG